MFISCLISILSWLEALAGICTTQLNSYLNVARYSSSIDEDSLGAFRKHPRFLIIESRLFSFIVDCVNAASIG